MLAVPESDIPLDIPNAIATSDSIASGLVAYLVVLFASCKAVPQARRE